MKTVSQPREAKYFIEQLGQIHNTSREEVAHLWGMRDLFVDDFVSLLGQGLSYKKHPSVCDALALLFTFADEAKNGFFARVIEIACERVGREKDDALVYQDHLAIMIERSSFFRKKMSGPKEAVRRLKTLKAAA